MEFRIVKAIISSEHIVDIRSAPPPIGWGVVVSQDAIGQLAELWKDRHFADPSWDYPGLPKALSGDDWYTFCVLGCSVIACIWPPNGEETWAVEYEGEWLDDAPGVFACFSRLIDARGGFDLRMLEGIAAAEFFSGRGVLQLVDEKWELLTSVVSAIHERWSGSVGNLVSAADADAEKVASLIGETIPGFFDSPDSPAGVLPFQKLAYLATSMMSSGGPKPFANIDRLPVFPDYMLPRILRHLGVLQYAKGLSLAVDNRRVLKAGAQGELAMRWATVYAADRLLEALRDVGASVTTPQLDFALWEAAVLGPDADRMGEHHRVLTLAY
jgi:hypothetical protein